MSEGPRIEALLMAVPFFATLDRVDLARLAGVLEEVHHPKSAVLFKEASEADALYLLQQGRVRVSVRTRFRRRTIADLSEGEYFGELGLLLERRTASATALTDVTLWKLPRERFEELVQESPALGLRMAASLAALVDRRSRESVGAPVAAWKMSALGQKKIERGDFGIWRLVSLGIALGLPLVFWWVPPPEGLTVQGWRVILVVLGAAVAWLLEPLPDFVVTLLMAAAWGVAGLAPVAAIFGGFASSSWVLGLGALGLAAAMVRSGLMFRVSLAVLRRFPANHQGQVAALLVGGLFLTPLVPLALGRVAAIAPFTKELARGLGYADRSRGAAVLALAGIIGYSAFSSIFLTGLAMNFFVLDLLPRADRLETTWISWLVRAVPTGLVLLVGAAFLLLVCFRPDKAGAARNVERQEHVLGPMTSREIATIAALAVMLIGFLDEPLHHINPAWFAIAAIGVAVGGGGLNRELFRRSIDWGFLAQFGILLSAGGVLHAHAVDAWVAGRLLAALHGRWEPATLVMLLAGFVVVVRLFVPWIPATLLLSLALVPVAPHVGLSSWVVGFVVLVTANAWLHPNQSDYCRVARDTAGELFDQGQALMAGVAMTVLTLVGLAIAIPYWRALGLLAK